MTNNRCTLFKWINVTVDYLLLNASLYAAFVVVNPANLAWVDVYDFRLKILLLNFSWFYCSNIFGIYRFVIKRDAVPTITANIASLGLYAMFAVALKLLIPHINFPLLSLYSLFLIFPPLLLLWKFSFLLLRKYNRKLWVNSNIVIIGTGAAGIDLYSYIKRSPHLDYNVLGFFDDNNEQIHPGINWLGKIDDCFAFASKNRVHEIYCALPEGEKVNQLLQEADKHMIRFRLLPDIKGGCYQNFMVELFGFTPILIPRPEPLENKANEIVKRGFDILFSSLIIVFLLSWFVPLIAIFIKLDSKGPVFFKQLRSGKDNKPFCCYKFRSMTPNVDADRLQATKNDMRVTRVGRFMRKTSIDELPQFFNVLMGDMSVVGPRPHMIQHTEAYSSLINNYMVRHFLTPGITGWAQVNGFRGETKETTAMQHRVQADIWYLENWSLLLDLKIVLLTIFRMAQSDDNAF